ncbi:MAG: hypothetical protein M0C28_11810 [Candidatus Moduliflexus flocculans]|nr:hypothetical protein [Candidatus Moduliflexus flocculans]
MAKRGGMHSVCEQATQRTPAARRRQSPVPSPWPSWCSRSCWVARIRPRPHSRRQPERVLGTIGVVAVPVPPQVDYRTPGSGVLAAPSSARPKASGWVLGCRALLSDVRVRASCVRRRRPPPTSPLATPWTRRRKGSLRTPSRPARRPSRRCLACGPTRPSCGMRHGWPRCTPPRLWYHCLRRAPRLRSSPARTSIRLRAASTP